MKILKSGYMLGEHATAKRLGTTRDTIRWLIKIRKIKPAKVLVGRMNYTAFSLEEQIIIKCWVNRKKAR